MTTSLDEGARAFGIPLTRAQGDAFETYYRELVAWNARVNLTAITARDDQCSQCLTSARPRDWGL
jgi:16S rRNA G527 N7-methylase RsmG